MGSTLNGSYSTAATPLPVAAGVNLISDQKLKMVVKEDWPVTQVGQKTGKEKTGLERDTPSTPRCGGGGRIINV